MNANRLRQFISKRVVEEGSCRLWVGQTSATGHPAMMLPGIRRKVMVRRQIHATLIGPIPGGHVVVTTCGCRTCVKTEHLKAVPLAEARRLAAERGEYFNRAVQIKRTLTQRARSHITEEMVQAVREAPTAKQAHERTGISLGHCYAIRTGARRKPLDSPFGALFSPTVPRRA